MKNDFLLHNCIIISPGSFIKNGEVLVSGGKITAVGSDGSVSENLPEKTLRYDLGGRFLLPGFVNPHAHLYSSLSAGLSPLGVTDTFNRVLSNFWWPLDAAMDAESVYYSAVSGVIDAVKHGVTCIFDHHASMNFVEGSLDQVERAFDLAGLKGVLCFETSDRTSSAKPSGHLEENVRFIKKHLDNRRVRGMLGLHANFTLGNNVLNLASAIVTEKPGDFPVHIHCGEAEYDYEFCKKEGFGGPVDRLHSFGLISPKTILAHCVHLGERDRRIIEDINPWVISNPESNANNRVGKLDRGLFNRYLLGTDGMSFDMVASLRSQYLLGAGLSEDYGRLYDVFINEPHKLINLYFPETGLINEGYDADIAVLDYVPETPVNENNIAGHLIFGARGGKTFMTVSDGNILYHDGKITFTFESSIKNEIKKAAENLHRRYYG